MFTAGPPQINNGVYKSGFATTQVGYDRAQQGLYAALDEVEAHLQRSRFLLGDRWAAPVTSTAQYWQRTCSTVMHTSKRSVTVRCAQHGDDPD